MFNSIYNVLSSLFSSLDLFCFLQYGFNIIFLVFVLFNVIGDFHKFSICLLNLVDVELTQQLIKTLVEQLVCIYHSALIKEKFK